MLGLLVSGGDEMSDFSTPKPVKMLTLVNPTASLRQGQWMYARPNLVMNSGCMPVLVKETGLPG